MSDIGTEAGFLRQIPLFANFTEEQDQAWSSRCTIQSATAGTTLYDPDKTDKIVLFNLSGIIRAILRVAPGKEFVLDDFQPGAIVGALNAINGHWKNGFLMAATDVEAIIIPPEVFQDILQTRHDVCVTLLSNMTARMRHLYHRMAERSYLDVKSRLYNSLLRLSLPCPEDKEQRIITPPIIHAVLAEHVGASRESVSREMSRLLQDAVIERTFDAIIIRQPRELLRRLAQAAPSQT
ncbi:Crp/Fnr family transcriptional regulator [Rhizobium sp.]|jgi:CRP/FNR family transcriptional regulator, cyclic AMP receptor protein|uniref:Crp/Fnr family transcriptional regulator n=1 Tax=Rhizobium sp. TaxID=391 RepID=UPI000E9966D4|nr:Crp/Fnr family transcriptional regulator [Rhizobium sp.]